MNAQLNWLQAGDEPVAHYCAVNERKAAAVCGYADTKPWHRPEGELVACERCEAIAAGSAPIVFTMPDGSRVTVRERR
jgi:hypothetical protein